MVRWGGEGGGGEGERERGRDRKRDAGRCREESGCPLYPAGPNRSGEKDLSLGVEAPLLLPLGPQLVKASQHLAQQLQCLTAGAHLEPSSPDPLPERRANPQTQAASTRVCRSDELSSVCAR